MKKHTVFSSVKSNIGHLTGQGRGVIKVLLAMQQRKFRNLHLQELNPLLNLKKSFYIVEINVDKIKQRGSHIPFHICEFI